MHADDIASLAKGVQDVKNYLTVGDPSLTNYDLGFDPNFYSYWDVNRYPKWPYAGYAEVKDDIDVEMFLSLWVDSDDITVKVTNEVVMLTGTVNSWFSYKKATENAYEGGADQVFNNITIK